jgi:hypothetical protein
MSGDKMDVTHNIDVERREIVDKIEMSFQNDTFGKFIKFYGQLPKGKVSCPVYLQLADPEIIY